KGHLARQSRPRFKIRRRARARRAARQAHARTHQSLPGDQGPAAFVTTVYRIGMRFASILALAAACSSDPGGVPRGSPSSDSAYYKNGGGCYPTGVLSQPQDMIVLVNPEWVPVVGGRNVDSAPILVHGIAHRPHGDTGGDAPMTHTSSDLNATLELDPEDAWRAASGNIADEDGFLELEWESAMVPDWAWPGEGDRVAALGRWIFDCGHPGEQPGQCSATAAPCIIDGDCAVGESCVGSHFRYQSEI